MAITDIQQQVFDLVSRSSDLSFVSSDQETTRLGLTPGQRVVAEVASLLPDNRAQVRIGTNLLNLNLPMGVRVGQSLEMTFISEDPRSTFAIARQGGMTAPVSLSDASRLLGLLVGSERIVDPGLRSTMQSIGEMLRRSSGDSSVLANLMDEAITYGRAVGETVPPTPTVAQEFNQPGQEKGSSLAGQGGGTLTPEQARLNSFQANASQILLQIARNSRFTLLEAVNQPVVPLLLMPGEEVDAAVVGTLPDGRAFVQVAGSTVELMLPRGAEPGNILRLTFISAHPKPVFAMPRTLPGLPRGEFSEAGRWLSVLEHRPGGVSDQQLFVLERLNRILSTLPPDSPAFTAILEEAVTYETIQRNARKKSDEVSQPGAAALAAARQALQGSGITLGDDMAKLLQALIRGQRLALIEAMTQQSSASAGLMPGQQIRAEVLATLGGGRFMVQVGEQVMEFHLPKGVAKGDALKLIFIADDPKPTFLMVRFGGARDARLSPTGRWVSELIGRSQAAPSQAPEGLLRTLLSGPPTDPVQVEEGLQHGLRGSGLFYESHLARWFAGEYSYDELVTEPQARLGAQPQGGREPAVPELLPQNLTKQGALEVVEAAFRKAGEAESPHQGVVDPRHLAVVREQLDLLQSGQVVYRGDLFPGQSMDWSVQERQQGRKRQSGRDRSWESSVKITLPKLGGIKAVISLEGTSVSVSITADELKAVATMEGGVPALAQQLEAAGLEPGQIGIRHGKA